MSDPVCLLLALVCFAASALLVSGLDRLEERQGP